MTVLYPLSRPAPRSPRSDADRTIDRGIAWMYSLLTVTGLGTRTELIAHDDALLQRAIQGARMGES